MLGPCRELWSLPWALLCLCVLSVSSCAPAGEPLTLVRRSVLDQRIRMITLRYGADHYLAYDLSACLPYKLWRGSVAWDGAAFNNLKTVQPTSHGTSYWEQKVDQGWRATSDDIPVPVEVSYRGYQWTDRSITFTYALTVQGGDVAVEETPSIHWSADQVQWQRTFRIRDKPANVTLWLDGETLVDRQERLVQRAVVPRPSKPQGLVSTHGSQYWLDRSGCNTCHYYEEAMIGPSYRAIASRYENDPGTVELLTSRVKEGTSGVWGQALMTPHPHIDDSDLKHMVRYILSLEPKVASEPRAAAPVALDTAERYPGFGAALTAVHPCYDLVDIRPPDFRPRVGGMDFLPDGRLLVSTWDSTGSVYAISHLDQDDPAKTEVTQMASGLAEPLGLTVVDEDIFVLQKHELTQLRDEDGDGRMDHYICVSDDFEATPDFHEFSYGLQYADGYFYGALGLAMRLMSSEQQLEDRGTVFRASRDGTLEIIARGLRQPNGILVDEAQDIFVTENQGQWSPACKVIHIREGAFYGCQFGTGDRFAEAVPTAPAVWLPQDEIGNSPSQPLWVPHGPFEGQMIFGEVTHGGIKRVFLEKVQGAYQGCVFRFVQGLEAGINRMAWGPEGDLYVGGVGMNGNWTHQGNQFGLQKLTLNGKPAFDLHEIRALPDGFEVTFTQPLSRDCQAAAEPWVEIQQWRYEATPAYGGPKLEQTDLQVTQMTSTDDGRRWHLEVPGLREGFVVYFLFDRAIQSASDQGLWSGEAWYTLNHIPTVESI